MEEGTYETSYGDWLNGCRNSSIPFHEMDFVYAVFRKADKKKDEENGEESFVSADGITVTFDDGSQM